MKEKSVKRQWMWAIICAIIMIAGLVTPDPAGLTHEGKMSLIIMFVSIVLWVTEVMPIPIAGWFMVAFVPFFGILSFNDTWAASINFIILFYFICFAFASFLKRSSFAIRLTGKILQWSKNSSSKAILGFMVVTAIISTVMDNLPLTAVMLPIAYTVLDAAKAEEGKSNLGKAMALAIPFSAAIGGIMTPSGCIMNIMCIAFAEQAYGITVTFAQWFAVGAPSAVIALLIAWWALIKVFKPENLSDEAVAVGIDAAKKLPVIPSNEKYGLVVIVGTLIVWVLGSWVPILNMTAVAMISLGIMFLPGLEIMHFDHFVEDSPWGMMILMMAVNVLVAAMMASGATDWLVEVGMAPIATASAFVVLLACSIIACILHNLIPAGPAVAGLITIPFLGLAAAAGASMTTMIFICAWWSSISFILPLDAVPLLAYAGKRKYFTMTDMMKVGWIPSVGLVIVTVTVVPFIVGLLGLS